MRLEVNMLAHASPLSSVLVPTEVFAEAMSPILSSLGTRFLLLSMPSRLTLIFHSPFGRADSGVSLVSSLFKYSGGSG